MLIEAVRRESCRFFVRFDTCHPALDAGSPEK